MQKFSSWDCTVQLCFRHHDDIWTNIFAQGGQFRLFTLDAVGVNYGKGKLCFFVSVQLWWGLSLTTRSTGPAAGPSSSGSWVWRAECLWLESCVRWANCICIDWLKDRVISGEILQCAERIGRWDVICVVREGIHIDRIAAKALPRNIWPSQIPIITLRHTDAGSVKPNTTLVAADSLTTPATFVFT